MALETATDSFTQKRKVAKMQRQPSKESLNVFEALRFCAEIEIPVCKTLTPSPPQAKLRLPTQR